MNENYFQELNKVDCSASVEKKGRFTYLSWPFAVGALLTRYPTATWVVYETERGPYFQTEAGCFVKVGVTVEGIERIQWHPVLDQNNKTVKVPDAFQVNTSIQRGLVKAIALHGLGLYIYAGEDLPDGAKVEKADDREPVSVNDMKNKLAELMGGRKEAKAHWLKMTGTDQDKANAVFVAGSLKELGIEG